MLPFSELTPTDSGTPKLKYSLLSNLWFSHSRKPCEFLFPVFYLPWDKKQESFPLDHLPRPQDTAVHGALRGGKGKSGILLCHSHI